MKALLIKQCPDSMRWYSKMVGECVTFISDAGYGEYRSRDAGGHINFVQHADAVIVEGEIVNGKFIGKEIIPENA
jgi:hypothetical protein